MSNFWRRLATFLPLVAGLAILAVAAPLVPWSKVWPYLTKLSPVTIGLLVVCSLAYYFGRILRYWLMLRMLDQPVSLARVALACLVAQPVSVLPAGEMYRGVMLKRYGDVPMRMAAPSVFAQSVAESVGLLIIALIGAVTLHRYTAILLGLGVVFGGIIWFSRWSRAHRSHRLLNKLPFVQVSPRWLRSFFAKNRVLFQARNFGILILTSLISTGAGVGIILIAGGALGAGLSPFEAAIAYALPTTLEAVSFLPAGLGINEGSSVSLLTLFGASLPLAVALTILVRLFTLGVGFAYGFMAMGVDYVGNFRRHN